MFKKNPIAKHLIFLFLVHINCVAQELPADFGDIINDNPTDVSLINFLWMVIIAFLILFLSFKKIVKFKRIKANRDFLPKNDIKF